METKKYTAVIILNYNNVEDTINCVKSVEKFNTAPIKYVIVDNGSKRADAVTILDREFSCMFGNDYSRFDEFDDIGKLPYISLVISQINDGYASGNNKGLKFAFRDNSIDNILILNSDVLFVEDIISKLVDDLRKTPAAAIISPLLYKKNLMGIDYNCCRKALTLKQIFLLYLFAFTNVFNVTKHINESRNLLLDKSLPLKNPMVEIELPSGSCMLLDKLFFHEIGNFDSNTFLYCEEDILYAKIQKNGKKNFLDTSLKCIHLGATTTATVPSKFILDCGIKSNHYYLTHYTKASTIYLICMKCFYCVLRIKSYLRRK